MNNTAEFVDGDARRLTLKGILRDLGERFFSLESGWLRTFRELITQPGPMIRRYVRGTRRSYANPFAYLIGCTAITLLMHKLFGFRKYLSSTTAEFQMDSPLQAEMSEQIATIFQAVEGGADVNSLRDGKKHATALMIAVGKNDLEMAGYLLEHGADASLKNRDGDTAMDLASSEEMKALVSRY